MEMNLLNFLSAPEGEVDWEEFAETASLIEKINRNNDNGKEGRQWISKG